MKVLLINQSNGVHANHSPPLGILCLASALIPMGHEVRIHDQGAPECRNRFPSMEDVRAFGPDVVGISLYTFGIGHSIAFAKALKAAFPGIVLLLGGHHATALPERTMTDIPETDVLVYGEGEDTIRELLGSLVSGGDMGSIRGMVWRQNGRLRVNEPRPLRDDLDSRPFPANELIQRYRYASEGLHKGKKVLNVIASRGCPFYCAYCNKAVYGASYRQRSVGNVLDEIEHMFRTFGYDEVMFHDELFTANRSWVHEFLSEMERRGLSFPWRVLGRVGLVDQELLDAMAGAGLYVIAFGVEAGNDEVRRDVGRKMRNEEILESFAMAECAGLITYAFNMINHRKDTKETVAETYRLMTQINATLSPVFVCSPFPGSRIHELLDEKTRYDWDRFNSYRDFTSMPISICALPESDLMFLAEQMESFYYSRWRYLIWNLFGTKERWRIRSVVLSLWGGFAMIRLKHLAKDPYFVTRPEPGRAARGLYRILHRIVRGLLGLFKGVPAARTVHERL